MQKWIWVLALIYQVKSKENRHTQECCRAQRRERLLLLRKSWKFLLKREQTGPDLQEWVEFAKCKGFLGEGFMWHGRGGVSAFGMFGDQKSDGAFSAWGRVSSRDDGMPTKLGTQVGVPGDKVRCALELSLRLKIVRTFHWVGVKREKRMAAKKSGFPLYHGILTS